MLTHILKVGRPPTLKNVDQSCPNNAIQYPNGHILLRRGIIWNLFLVKSKKV